MRKNKLGKSDRDGAYRSWQAMKNRCRYKKNKNWHQYGGRGIKICERWSSFANFFSDMGGRPVGKTLDRIDTNGDYSPENCRWATTVEQRVNRRSAILITYKGKTQNQKQWAKELDLFESTIIHRRERGIKDPAQLLSKTPLPTELKGEKHYAARLTEADVRFIRSHYVGKVGSGSNSTDLGKKFGVSSGTILAVVQRKNWKHI